MKKHYLVLAFTAFIFTVAFLFSACRKINDYTDLGSGLIPPVDNINTFDTSLRVFAYNDTFSLTTDSFRITKNDRHYLGLILNDPIFGKTDAQIFMELKPEFYANYPFARRDSTKLDSLVLILGYADRYGDSTIAQTINVYELTQAFKIDSAYLVRKPAFSHNVLPLNLPGQLIFPSRLDDSVKAFRDTTAGQMRIKLDTNFARRLMNYDTTNAYRTDSSFRSNFKGFALKSEMGGNAIIGFNMKSANTKLAFYYRIPKPGGGDSLVVTYFNFTVSCNSANYVTRNYTGTAVASAAGQPNEAAVVYIQQTPGTFANIRIPDISLLTNRVVHRAELIVEQLYDPSDDKFTPPAVMYLDAYDPTITSSYKFRTIPYSLALSRFDGNFNFKEFGTSPLNEKDPLGNHIKVWKFNLSRYLQNILNGKQTSYDLRLYSPLAIRGKTRSPGDTTDFELGSVYVGTSIANGRIRVGGGNHPSQRMRLRIVYSKL